ncbi:MAG: DUF2442 domain-containing protein [Burkholderiales bacterium]|nr:DUF2442 domain-containing protein [Burkholderiales bacterium]
MLTSAIEIELPLAEGVTITDDTLCVDLSDGRSISVPLAWYPRLVNASKAERDDWRLIGRGAGIHWQGIDEDISVEGLLSGRPSGESQTSLARWLAERKGK